MTCALQQLVLPSALSHAHDDAALAVALHPGMVFRHIGQKIFGRIGIGEFVVIVAKTVGGMVKSAQGDECVKHVGTAEEEVSRMETAHAASRDNEGLLGCPLQRG